MTRDIEDMLEQMPLRQPSGELDRRIARVVAAEAPQPLPIDRSRQWRIAGYLGLAAMLVLGATLAVTLVLIDRNRIDRSGHSPQLGGGLVFEPVRSESTVTHMWDDGIVYLDHQQPMRRIKQQQVQHVQWHDAARDITMEATLPAQEQWTLIPLVFD